MLNNLIDCKRKTYGARGLLESGSSTNNSARLAWKRTGRRCQFSYADFFRSVGNTIIFPRCSTGTHFTFALNRLGM
jgi:hypothetical protein